MEDLIDSLNKVYFIDDAVGKATWLCQKVGFMLVPFFGFFAIGWNFIITFIRNFPERPKFFEWSELGRVMILMFVLTFYQPIFGGVAAVANAINRGTAPDAAYLQQSYSGFQKQIEAQMQKGKEAAPRDQMGMPEEMPATESETSSFNWFGFLSSPMDVVTSILAGLASTIVVVVEYVIRMVAITLGKVLYAIGPLAVAFSIFPAFSDRFSFWFGSFINVLFVGTTCNVLNYIVYGSFWNSLAGGTSLNDPIAQLTFYLSIIVCYAFAFWLTSKFVGSNESGKVITSGLTQAGAWAGNLLSGGAASAAAGAAGKGAGFESMVDTGKKISEQ